MRTWSLLLITGIVMGAYLARLLQGKKRDRSDQYKIDESKGATEEKLEEKPVEDKKPEAPKKPTEEAPKKPKEDAVKASAPAQDTAVKEPPKKKRPDPKDYMFSRLKGQTCIKVPGTINGQMFIIEDCEDCDIYVCDHLAQVQIDYCKGCRIFVGPTESSVFIRNCEDCKCIFACQQYRSRECKNCDTLLFASTAPVIEESVNMRFGCFRFFYSDLARQFCAANISVFDNKWSEIYDFTPKDGNWSFLPLDVKSTDLLNPLSSLASFVSEEEEKAHSDVEVVPLTAGNRKKDFANLARAFVLIMPSAVEEGARVLSKLHDQQVLMQTKQMTLDSRKAKELLLKSGEHGKLNEIVKKPCVGVEVASADAPTDVAELFQEEVQAGKVYVSGTQDAASYEITLFFDQVRETAAFFPS